MEVADPWEGIDAEPPCWCGEKNPYYEPVHGGCDGWKTIYCLCAGDFCCCHNHGEVECFGCEDCERETEDDDYWDVVDAAEEWDEVPA